jgi:glyoxylate/hydroxypyruvate reductase A
MAIALVCPGRTTHLWIDLLKAQDPSLQVDVWPDLVPGRLYEMAITWNHPPGSLAAIPGLKCVSSLGAGVDHIMFDETFPEGIPVTRIVDAGLATEMAEYVTLMTLVFKRELFSHLERQRARIWRKDAATKQDRVLAVGVMGVGEMGSAIIRSLTALEIPVVGWSRTTRHPQLSRSYAGPNEFRDFLGATNILVCALPLYRETEGILCRETFYSLPHGSYVINVGRGRHLIEEDLLSALDDGQVAHAALDVFRTEPLPEEHPFWSHPHILLTTHIAAITRPENVARQLVENYHRVCANEPLLNTVDRSRGY